MDSLSAGSNEGGHSRNGGWVRLSRIYSAIPWTSYRAEAAMALAQLLPVQTCRQITEFQRGILTISRLMVTWRKRFGIDCLAAERSNLILKRAVGSAT
jgi:hypothetical protein